MNLLYRNIILALIITTIIYIGIKILYSYFRYLKFRNNSIRLYDESRNRSRYLGLPICQISGCLCKEIKECNFDQFVEFIESYFNKYGTIHMLTTTNNVFFNMLENHLLTNNCIIIGGTAIMPSSYLNFICIVSYLASTDKIITHINNDSKYSDSAEELYEDYMQAILYLKNIDEFKDINDIIAINYSAELKDKKLIWMNSDTNILYMHGYENDPISMLLAILYNFHKIDNKSELIQKLNSIIYKFMELYKLSLYTFIEDNSNINLIDNVIASSISAQDSSYFEAMESIEDTWKYNMYATSIWRYHDYTNSLLESIDEKNN